MQDENQRVAIPGRASAPLMEPPETPAEDGEVADSATAQPPSRLSLVGRGTRRAVYRLAVQREAALAAFLLIGGGWLAYASPEFLTSGNIHAVLLGMSVKALVAVGMTVLLVSGGFDLSVGSVLGLGGIVAAQLAVGGTPVPVAIMAAVACGVLVGLTNGFLIAKVGINPLIATLGMLNVVRGIVFLIGGGFGVSNLPDSLTAMGQSVVWTLQLPIIMMIVLAVVGDLLLRRSRHLRLTYYVGGNEQAARLTGIPVDRVKMACYALTGGLAAFAGVVTAARFGSASVDAGTGLELDVIIAVVIGGASLAGGTGTVRGAMLGLLLNELIFNAFNLLAVNVYWQPVAQGTVLILAVGADALTRRSQGRSYNFFFIRRRPAPRAGTTAGGRS